jgi:DNA-binding transcriptional ArsR family regulator
MGASKTDHFSENHIQISLLFKALAHPARIAIIEHLIKVNSCICNDLVNEIPLAQATISQHLKELKIAGIIKGNIEGNTICYCLNELAIEKLSIYIDHIRQQNANRTNCC